MNAIGAQDDVMHSGGFIGQVTANLFLGASSGWGHGQHGLSHLGDSGQDLAPLAGPFLLGHVIFQGLLSLSNTAAAFPGLRRRFWPRERQGRSVTTDIFAPVLAAELTEEGVQPTPLLFPCSVLASSAPPQRAVWCLGRYVPALPVEGEGHTLLKDCSSKPEPTQLRTPHLGAICQ